MKPLTQNGKAGKVYWQDDNLVHVEDQWQDYGHRMAAKLEIAMRDANGIEGWEGFEMKPLCPACYMLIGYNMLVALAQRNGQRLVELKESMSRLFSDMDLNSPYTDTVNVVCELPSQSNSDCMEETG